MIEYKCIPQEFIQNTFQPMVAVLSSVTAEQICQTNNLSFVELLQPFRKFSGEVSLRDPAGTVSPIKNLRVSLVDANARPPTAAAARKLLNHVVSSAGDQTSIDVKLSKFSLKVPSAVPWFEAWRETFLQVQFPSEHEFTKHLLGCILVVASHEPDLMQSFDSLSATLNQMLTNTGSNSLPKWISPNIFRYYVVLHDKCEPPTKPVADLYTQVVKRFGSEKSFFLEINSRTSDNSQMTTSDPWCQYLNVPTIMHDDNESSQLSSSDTTTPISSSTEITSQCNSNVSSPISDTIGFHPLSPSMETHVMPPSREMSDWPSQTTLNEEHVSHGALLTAEDLEQLHRFIQHFCINALIPHVEGELVRITELVSNKKGVSRSIFSATKRWFGTNKPGSSGSFIPLSTYAPDSTEMQLRRLADLYFMFGHYSMAFQVYHSVKRDFNADQAWLHYAGALEMAALSAFMMGDYSRKAQDYFDEAISVYLSNCRMPQFATRATLMSTECLRASRLYGEAAKQLIRMTSEDSDLRSAILLEQAAYFFLKAERNPMGRKYAFHIVLAGHRYSKAGQKKHTLRCYMQAYQVYEDKEWILAEDHINFTIGRQAAVLNRSLEAILAYSKLLTPSTQQTASQQSIFLRELNATLQAAAKGQSPLNNLPTLPLPLIDGSLTKVLFTSVPPITVPRKVVASNPGFLKNISELIMPKWGKLEEFCIHEAQGSVPITFKPSIIVHSNKTNNSTKPLAVVSEMISVVVSLFNPIKLVLVLRDIRLLWTFVDLHGEEMTNEHDSVSQMIHPSMVPQLVLQPEAKDEVVLSLIPLAVGSLKIKGIIYSLHGQTSNEPIQSYTFPSTLGKQDIVITGKRVKVKDRNKQTSDDLRLSIDIIEAAPSLQVTFREINTEVIAGELQEIAIELLNVGKCAMTNLYLATSTPDLYSFISILPETSRRNVTLSAKEQFRKQFVFPIILPNEYHGRLLPGQNYNFDLLMRAPQQRGKTSVDLHIYYENVDPKMVPRYRMMRHSWDLTVEDSLSDYILTELSEDCCPTNKINIGIQLKNANPMVNTQTTELDVLEVSLLSKRWKLENLREVPASISVASQRSLHLMFWASEKRTNQAQFSTVKLSPGDHNKKIHAAFRDFIKRTHVKSTCLDDFEDMTNENNQVEKDDELSIEDEGVILIRWKANVTDTLGNMRQTLGMHQLFLVKTPQIAEDDDFFTDIATELDSLRGNLVMTELERRNEFNLMELNQKCVTYAFSFDPVVRHAFDSELLCVVPVILTIHNCTATLVHYRVQLFPPNINVINYDKTITTTPFRWGGYSGGSVELLQPHASIQHKLKAIFCQTGSYDLSSHLEIFASCHDKFHGSNDLTVQSWKLQSILLIQD